MQKQRLHTKEQIEEFKYLQDIIITKLCSELDDDSNFIGEDY